MVNFEAKDPSFEVETLFLIILVCVELYLIVRLLCNVNEFEMPSPVTPLP